ncbi:uncharacterized protein EAE97_006997 [Botrytis byssoidea]|uniref:Single-strand DNA deaminase toxin A-like C-terminal domain-containing protein n=1 Tax=Botrytis byssoidea TaxID=139641 RepID=A0A9P5M4N3_9HELO|nr:uncharacterized protein EAE97_006997 [Botrytis byssoidea]KAF7940811.1 hypothetical protein EAE97_006997 [Botrytis byssoidea]
MTEALRLSELGSARQKQPYELMMEATALLKLRKAEEEAKSRQSQAESGNIPVVQELNSNEADETLVGDEPATESHENNGARSTNYSKDTSNGIGDLIEAFSETTLETPVIKKAPKGIWNELTDNADPKLTSYRSLDITPDPSWLESILSKVNSILEKTADGGQLKGGDKDSAIGRRNDILKILIQGALELGSHILDSPEIARKLAAQHGIQNEDSCNAVPSIGTGTDNSTDENINIVSTPCENCCDTLAPHQEVEVTEKPTQDSRDRSIWFKYHSKRPQSLYYTIDLYERVHRFHLEKFEVKKATKTVARLYVPTKSPPPTRRPTNFDASKAQVINAISGWVPMVLEKGCPNSFIPNKIWTEKVQQMCQTIGYKLRDDSLDRGNPGIYNACHAEKKVIAYWLYTHVLSTLSSNQCVIWEKGDEPIRPEYYEGLFIVVSKPFCNCCVDFMNRVANYYKISFAVHCPDKVFNFPY